MRVAVLGAGAMGSWFGGKLSQYGCAVQLLTTNKAHRETITSDALTLRENDIDTRVLVEAMDPTDVQAPVDLVLLFTKTFQSRKALAAIAHAIDDNTHVLSLQNGLGNAESIASQIPLERAWIGVTMIPIDKIEPGVVACKGHGVSFFGNAANDNDQPMARHILAAFEPTKISLQHVLNVHQRIWEKVAFNAGMNALTALSHGRPGTIGESAGAQALAQDVATEVALVAKSQQIEINLDSVFSMIELSCTKHAEHIPSMLQDLLSKRRTEVDALNGAIVDIAHQAGVPAPLNNTLATLVRLAELSHQRYG